MPIFLGIVMREHMIFPGIVRGEHLKELHLKEELTEEVYVLPAIIRFMRKNMKTITLDELSLQFHMSESELKRYIVRESGYTYRYLLRDLRLRRAVELLRNTKLSMERIMEETGYSNMNNFTGVSRSIWGKLRQSSVKAEKKF